MRTYSVGHSYREIPRLAEKHGLNVALGAWISGDPEADKKEMDTLIYLARHSYKNIVRVIVGNEAIFRTEVTIAEAIENLKYVKKRVWTPVSLAEPWHVWIDHLAEAHEWAEALWLRHWRRKPIVSAEIPDTERPMVSIHVPAYNEPPLPARESEAKAGSPR
ncbi:MAG: hypothetical protein ABW068_06065 [Candidatus Thiodiazotropha sp.]